MVKKELLQTKQSTNARPLTLIGWGNSTLKAASLDSPPVCTLNLESQYNFQGILYYYSSNSGATLFNLDRVACTWLWCPMIWLRPCS